MSVLNFFASNSGSSCRTHPARNLFCAYNSSLSSSLKMFLKISSIRIEFSKRLFRVGFRVSLKRRTPNTVPSTFLWHQFCNIDHKTFSFFHFSLSSNGFPIACFLYFQYKEQNHHENARNRGLQHFGNTDLSSVLVRGFREVGEIVVQIVDEHRVTVHRSDRSCRTLWAHNLCLHLTWPGGQTSRCRCGVAHVLRF